MLGGLGGCALKHRFSIAQPCRVLVGAAACLVDVLEDVPPLAFTTGRSMHMLRVAVLIQVLLAQK